jgi:hypothetical protein
VSSTYTPTANVRLALPLEREELSFERAQAVLTVTGEKVQVDAGAVAGRLQCLNELPDRSRFGFRGQHESSVRWLVHDVHQVGSASRMGRAGAARHGRYQSPERIWCADSTLDARDAPDRAARAHHAMNTPSHAAMNA